MANNFRKCVARLFKNSD